LLFILLLLLFRGHVPCAEGLSVIRRETSFFSGGQIEVKGKNWRTRRLEAVRTRFSPGWTVASQGRREEGEPIAWEIWEATARDGKEAGRLPDPGSLDGELGDTGKEFAPA
jgi:hypothetical protein